MWSNPVIANVSKLYRQTFKLFYKSHRVEQQKIRDCSVIINDFGKGVEFMQNNCCSSKNKEINIYTYIHSLITDENMKYIIYS